jgi:hypothetical protein
MKTKHTPGPWSCGGFFNKGDGDKMPIICNREIDFGIDRCDIAYMCIGNEKMHSNARLIVAAPLMLEALKAIYADGHVVSVMSDNQLKIVKEAIAAAEGETP